MLHPSYTDLISVINSEVEKGEPPVVNSRYSIVLATAKRTNQLIDGSDPMISTHCPKPLSIAINELYQSKIKILTEDESVEEELRMKEELKELAEAEAKAEAEARAKAEAKAAEESEAAEEGESPYDEFEEDQEEEFEDGERSDEVMEDVFEESEEMQ